MKRLHPSISLVARAPWVRLTLAGTIVLSLAGCAALMQRQPAPGPVPATPSPVPQVPVEIPVRIEPLPGQLDATPVFNSNNPEIVQEPGILLSTITPTSTDDAAVFLDHAFEGNFSVFTHHIAKDTVPGEKLLYLGFLATNRTDHPVALDLLAGASYLSQPDAPFQSLEPLIIDPEGVVFAGPGDRIATDLLHGRSPISPQRFTLEPHQTLLLFQWSVPTTVSIGPPTNGRTTLLRMKSDGPIALSEVAYFAPKSPGGGFTTPVPDDFLAVLLAARRAGPAEPPATPYTPGEPLPKGPFRYGRVAGVSVGDRWTATVDGARLPMPGERLGFPIATAVLNTLGTGQVQSAPMLKRYEGSAYQAHGNYGVTYELRFPLDNQGDLPRTLSVGLSHPARVVGDRPATAAGYLDPPNRPVMFRGPVKVEWFDDQGRQQTRYTHLVIQHGQSMPPFVTLEVPAHTRYDVKVTLLFPADATPPQLLTLSSP
ncbi:MAG TPA: DUF3370 domain-containing protein [Stenomitos sp.]